MVNKAEFIESLTKRLGDKKAATAALETVVDEIQRAVSKGERVAITGFGVFEKRVRAARTARNPRTGESVKVKKTSVPAFRPGQGFKDVVTGAKKLPKLPTAAGATKTAAAKTTTARATKAAPATAARATTARKTTAAKKTTTTAAKKTTTRRARA